MQSEIREIRGS